MRILTVHAHYALRGGEDAVVEAETELLRSAGHEVEEVLFDVADLASRPRAQQAACTVWNAGAAARVRAAVQAFEPDVVHVHNTFPCASPAVFRAASGRPIVHTLHNYRWSCLPGTLFRDGAPCTACLGRAPWPGVRHACYHGDRAASAVVAAMLSVHRGLRTLDRVDVFLAPSSHVRDRAVQAGLPAGRIRVVPHFIHPGPEPQDGPREGVLYAGRLVPEKGVRVLAQAWSAGPEHLPVLTVLGDGPERALLEVTPGVRCLGAVGPAEVRAAMERARVLVVPSIWEEPFGRVVIEAYAAGLPVVAADVGGLGELIQPGITGLRVPPGEPGLTAAAVRTIAGLNDGAWRAASRAARAVARTRFAPGPALAQRVAVYEEAIRSAGGARPSPAALATNQA